MRVTTQMLNESSLRAGIPGIGGSGIENNTLLKATAKSNKKSSSPLNSLSKGRLSGFNNEKIRQAADILEKKAEKLSSEDNEDEAGKMKKIADNLMESITGSYSRDGNMNDRYRTNYDFWG